MPITKHIPNMLTCGNLLSGCLSILYITKEMPIAASIMILVAGLFDFLDGLAARLLHAHSPIGGDLDSLSDVVSFGVAPGFIMYWLMSQAFAKPILPIGQVDILPCVAFLLAIFSALRLARFNIDETQKSSFRGLPAPGMALFVVSITLALHQTGHLLDGYLGFWPIFVFVILLSFLMVSNIRFFSFKMKTAKWEGNEVRWIFLIIAIISIAIFRFLALPFVMLLYVILSVFFTKKME